MLEGKAPSGCMSASENVRGTMRPGTIAKVLAKCKLKYYRTSECAAAVTSPLCQLPSRLVAMNTVSAMSGLSEWI